MGILVGDVLEGFVAVVDEVVVAGGEAFDVGGLMLAISGIEDYVDGIIVGVKALRPPHSAVAGGARLGHRCSRPVAVEYYVHTVEVGPRV